MQQRKKMLLIALVDAITTQIYMDMFFGGFRIGISVIILPIFYFFNRRIHPIICGMYVGLVGVLFRGFIGIPLHGNFINAVMADIQILVFDIVYGVLYYLLFYRNAEKTLTRWAFVILFTDFTANIMELMSRIGSVVFEDAGIMNKLFIVAAIRSVIGVAVVLALKHYQMLLKSEAHERRYRQLVTMLSDLKSEVYFMSSNMEYIEGVMSDAFTLYENLEDSEQENRMLSLRIAKDVHEIKKNYLRVIHGIDAISAIDTMMDNMLVKDIYAILTSSMTKEIETKKLGVVLDIQVLTDVMITDHFLLMSVLRNLVTNAIEAMGAGEGAIIKIRHEKIDTIHKITVQDNGPGIKEKDKTHIFNPGFSTKFNKQTGEINRGLGLTLVQDIVEKKFEGTIDIRTKRGQGTCFIIEIPESSLEAVK